MPRGWGALHYSKICNAAEWSPYGMDFPGDDNAWGGGGGGVSYRRYVGSAGTFGPQGTVFVNPQFIHGTRSQGVDIGYNDPQARFNVLGQLTPKSGGPELTTSVNIEHEAGGTDMSMLLRWDTVPRRYKKAEEAPHDPHIPRYDALPEVVQVGARAARGEVQANLRTRVGRGGVAPPQVEVAARVAPGIRAGALLQRSGAAVRVSADRAGWLGAATATVAREKGVRVGGTLSTVTPKLNLSWIRDGIWCKLSGQVGDIGLRDREDRLGGRAVVEVGGFGPASLKVKATVPDLRAGGGPRTAVTQLSASVVFGDLPGDHSLVVGAQLTPGRGGRELQYGVSMHNGFYGFCGW